MGTLWLGAIAVVSLIGIVWIAQRLGRVRAERDFHAGQEERASRAQAIEEHVARLGSGELDRELRSWRRK